MTVPPEAITAGRRAARDMAPRMGDIAVAFELCEEIADEVLEAAAPLIAAAERDSCIQLTELRRDELADHSRQAHALPGTSAMLAAKAAALDEFADLLRGDRP